MRTIGLKILILSLILVSCNSETEINSSELDLQEVTKEAVFRDLGKKFHSIDVSKYGYNKSKKGESRYLSLYYAEFITDLNSGEVGNTIFFRDVGNRQLGSDFSPTNTLNGMENIFYYIDTSRPSEDLDIEVTTSAISRAINTWDELSCSDPMLIQIPSNSNFSTGYVAFLLGFQSDVPIVSEINQVGWMDADFFETIGGAGGSESILGVTFTFIWVDENNVPEDTNNDGRADTAIREIYYNDKFLWSDDASAINVESVALHETGHAFSQGHFGKLFQTRLNEKYHFSPRAVMNAGYPGGEFISLTGTDIAGHCGNWDTWPEE